MEPNGVVYHAMLVIAVVLMQYLTGLDQIKKSVVYTFFSGHMAVLLSYVLWQQNFFGFFLIKHIFFFNSNMVII